MRSRRSYFAFLQGAGIRLCQHALKSRTGDHHCDNFKLVPWPGQVVLARHHGPRPRTFLSHVVNTRPISSYSSSGVHPLHCPSALVLCRCSLCTLKCNPSFRQGTPSKRADASWSCLSHNDAQIRLQCCRQYITRPSILRQGRCGPCLGRARRLRRPPL